MGPSYFSRETLHRVFLEKRIFELVLSKFAGHFQALWLTTLNHNMHPRLSKTSGLVTFYVMANDLLLKIYDLIVRCQLHIYVQLGQLSYLTASFE